MAETYDWAGFYQALCEHGPELLVGIDRYEGGRALVAAIAAGTDAFWSEGLQALLAEGAGNGDLRGGVLAAVELWRETVLGVLTGDFSIEIDWAEVTVDVESSLITTLVAAATPADG